MKNAKKMKNLIICLSSTFIIISGLLSVYFSYLYHYKGHEIINEFNSDNAFDINTIKTVNKEKDKDFVILNLTDIQLCDIEDFFHRNTIKKEIDYLINKTNPDLITLTGDQTWSNENLMSTKCIIRWLDSYKIPWAPIYGNHDLGNEENSAVASINKLSDMYENSKYCLYDRGPSNLENLGNYIINIKEDNKIVQTLYMINSGYGNYLSNIQKEWISYNANHIKEYNDNSYPQSILFMHKPMEQYSLAYYDYLRSDNKKDDVYCYCSLYGLYEDDDLFDLVKNINVKNVICGHQHTNCFTLPYDGIDFTFALKTGELSFYYDDGNVNLNGATTITINDTGTTINNIFVDSNKFHIKDSENLYETYYKNL